MVPRLGGSLCVAVEVRSRGWCARVGCTIGLMLCLQEGRPHAASFCRRRAGGRAGRTSSCCLMLLITRRSALCCFCLQEEGWEESGEELDDIFLGDAELWR